MSLAQGNNTPTRPRIELGSPDPESDALTTRPVRPPHCKNEENIGTLYFLTSSHFPMLVHFIKICMVQAEVKYS